MQAPYDYSEFATRDSVTGGMTIFLQRDNPDNYGSNGVYWLQTPEDEEEFYLVMRVYVPAPSVSYTKTWEPPLIVCTGG